MRTRLALLALVLGAGCNCQKTEPIQQQVAPDGQQSTVTVDRATGVVANGADVAVVTVTVKDAEGKPLPGRTVRLAATGDGNSLTQPASPTDESGVATGTLASSKAGTKVLSATVDPEGANVEVAQKPTVEFVAGAAARLAFAVPPSNVAAGATMTPSVQVSLVDSTGNPVTTGAIAVSLALGNNPGTASLAGTLTANTVAGVATFADLSLNKPGTGYTLSASSPGLTGATSTAFDVTLGAPAKLAFIVGPSNATAGGAIAPPLQVALEDAAGNVLGAENGTITVAIGTNPSAGTLSGTQSAATVAGVATFADLSIDKMGTGYTLAATATGFAGATSASFDVAAGAAAKLVISTEPPASSTAGATFAVGVSVQDAWGNRVASSTAAITLSLSTNPTSATLLGTLGANAAAGTASFSDLSLEKAGTGYVLSAAASGLTGASTRSFDITPATASKLVFAASPSAPQVAGAPFVVQVQVQDTFSNVVTSATDTIGLALGANPGSTTLKGTVSQAAVAGSASFSGLSIEKAAAGYTLVASTGSLPSVTSPAFDVTFAAAAQLAFSASPPATNVAGAAFSAEVVVQDAYGNLVNTATDSITLALKDNPGAATLLGTLTLSAAGGIASFSGLSVEKAATGYTLSASATSRTDGTSSAFDVTFATAAKIAFAVSPPSQVTAGDLFAVEVRVQDTYGNTVGTATDSVSLAIGNNPGSANLKGTTTATASAGVAAFSSLVIEKVGTGYTLVAKAGSFADATSAAFDVGPAAPDATMSTATASPTTIPGDGTTVSTILVTVKDGYGNPVPGRTVTLASTGTANTLVQPAVATDALGQASGSIASTQLELKTITATIDGTLDVAQKPVVTVGECTPSATQTCYSGPPGTAGVGMCVAGNQTCSAFGMWSGCAGEVTPQPETCATPGDDDCNGSALTCTGTTDCNPVSGACEDACLLARIGRKNTGCNFYPTVTPNTLLLNTGTFHFAVALANHSPNPTNVTITRGATSIATGTIPGNGVQVFNLPWTTQLLSATTTLLSSNSTGNGAYHVATDRPVAAYQYNPLEYTAGGNFSYTNDASLLFPEHTWSTSYRVVARNSWSGYNGFYAVTASQNNTTVTVTPSPTGGSVRAGAGIAANGTGSATLNAGDVLLVQSMASGAQNDPSDVTGTLVTSTLPVQVIGGHNCTDVPYNVTYCDHIEESVPGIELLSRTYLVGTTLIAVGTPKVQVVRIVATANNTTLSYSPAQAGAPTTIATAGGYVELAQSTASYLVTANEKVLVAQYMTGQSAGGGAGDPAMALAVGTDQYRSDYLFFAPTNYTSNFVNVIVPSTASVTLDGAAVPGASFTAIGATGYSLARLLLSNAGTGQHRLVSTSPGSISVYGYGQYTSYWYPGAQDLAIIP